MKTDWKVGDEFILVNASRTSLSEEMNGKVYKIAYTETPPKTSSFIKPSERDVVWIESTDCNLDYYYVYVNCIIPVTKLHKALL